ncbi:MAG TPA: hypothetical protein VIJ95_00935 [Hanamia sp.]
MINEFEYLCKRARLFFQFLDENKIDKIFPYREESKKELESKIAAESLQKIKNFNKLLDNLIIGKQYGFEADKKLELLKFLEVNLAQNQMVLIEQKISQYNLIRKKGFIKSRLEINDAIEIMNSDILGLTQENKDELNTILKNSMLGRI